MISKNTINTIFESARVEEVIGEFMQLKKSGSNFKGFSPFADEKTPSFMVSPVKRIWKDFSTGKGGNAVSFLMEHEHYSYPEALRWLAKKYNIEIEETEQTNEEKFIEDEKESMFLVSNFAKEYFRNIMLNSSQGKAVGLSYFKERGFREETIKKFELGYCLDEWDSFTKTALAKGFKLKYLTATGLTISKNDKHFDRFKARVIFPIHSMSGRVYGFGGRILTNDKKAAKYLNSPENEIYHKSKILYGIYQSKNEIAKQDNCYLVEGYTDAISFYQSGVKNVLASSGTALTLDQIKLINRLTKNITIIFDGDEAGIRASMRGIDLILEQQMNVKIVQLPKNEDPDSFAKSHSSTELKEYLESSAQDFINFKVSLFLKESKDDPVKKTVLIRDIVSSINKVSNLIQREIYIQECARIMKISEQVLFSELAQLLKKDLKESKRLRKSGFDLEQEKAKMDLVKDNQTYSQLANQLSVLEKEIIRIIILYGKEEVEFTEEIVNIDDKGDEIISTRKYVNTVSAEIYTHLQDDEMKFSNPVFQEIYDEIIYQLNQSKELEISDLLKHKNPNIVSMATSIIMDEENPNKQLSNWEGQNIFVKGAVEVLNKAVIDLIFNFRRVLIDSLMKEHLSSKKEYSEDEKELIINYNALRIKLFKKLNRVV